METSKTRTHALGYLAGVIPALSETFIYREILELQRRGFVLNLYSIHCPNRARVSADSLPLCSQTYYLFPVRLANLITAHAYFLCRKPITYFRSLWKMLTPMHHRRGGRWRTLMHWGESVMLARQMQKDGITHLHCQYIDHIASNARTVFLLTQIPYSISAHTGDIYYEKLMLPEKLEEARFIVCCSDSSRTELLKHGLPKHASKVRVVYHGVDTRLFAPKEMELRSENLILTIGRLDPLKGFTTLIEACGRLHKQGVVFTCEIVGEGSQRDELDTLIQKHDLKRVVFLKGAVLQENILAYYHRASIFVLPSMTKQGIPNVLMEALACGLPVVSTPLGGIPELIDNGIDGFLVQQDNPEELANCLRQILQDRSLRRTIGAAGREKVCTKFDNRKTIEPLVDLLSKEGFSEMQDRVLAPHEEPKCACC
ncbi:MAG: colanic acid biosynthesis glycosyltransferase WcaL [Pedosphaera sp.]|nr:colanic acid biosynthesis glycosyltransferase WcaL [Pedosphaera sp.]